MDNSSSNPFNPVSNSSNNLWLDKIQTISRKKALVSTLAVMTIIGVASYIGYSNFDIINFGSQNKAAPIIDASLDSSTFTKIVEKYKSATFSEKQSLKKQIDAVAIVRKQKLLTLASTNPSSFIKYAISDEKRHNLLLDNQPNIEKQIKLTGVIDHIHTDNFTNKKTYEYLTLTSNNKKYNLYLTNDSVSLSSGTIATIYGYTLDNNIVVNNNQRGAIEITQQNTSNDISTENNKSTIMKVLSILVNFQNRSKRKPLTTEQVKDILSRNTDSLASYYKTVSNNKLLLQGKTNSIIDVAGWYTIPFDDPEDISEKEGTIMNDIFHENMDQYQISAEALAKAAGVNTDGYDKIIITFPKLGPDNLCINFGTAYLGGKYAWVTNISNTCVYPYPSMPRVAIHEFGHTLNLDHASTYTCYDDSNNPITYSNNCLPSEYGDGYDVMGNGDYVSLLNGFHKAELSLVPSSNILTITKDGTYDIYPLYPNKNNSIQLIRIPKDLSYDGTVSEYYYLDYKQPLIPFDTSDFTPEYNDVYRGVSIRIGPDYKSKYPEYAYRLDMTPSYQDNLSTITINNTYNDGGKNISIKNILVSPEKATLEIKTAPANCPSYVSPSSSFIKSEVLGNSQSTVKYTARITNNNISNCPSSNLSINTSVNKDLFYFQNGPVNNIEIAPGETKNVDILLNIPDVYPGKYNLNFSIVDSLFPIQSYNIKGILNIIDKKMHPCKYSFNSENCYLDTLNSFISGTDTVQTVTAYSRIWDFYLNGAKKGQIWNNINANFLADNKRYYTNDFSNPGPCDMHGYSPEKYGKGYVDECNFSTRTISKMNNDDIEFITKAGLVWAWYFDGINKGKVWNNLSATDLTSINRYKPSTNDGPCDFADLYGYCVFNSQSYQNIDSKNIETVTAYGKTWEWDGDNIYNNINGIDLMSIDKYKNGPCSYKTDDQCSFTSQEFVTIDNSNLESVIAYGKIWYWYSDGPNKDKIWNNYNGTDLNTIKEYN